MTFKKNIDGAKLSGEIEGRLDTTTAPALEQELMPALDGITEARLSLEKLEYISSAGLRVLLSAQKKMSRQGKLVISGVNETVMEILEVTGFTDILTIE